MNRAADIALRVVGALVGLAAGALTAVWEAFLTPLYFGTVRLPLAPVLALGTGVALVWFTHEVTGHRLVALLPGLVWTGLMLVAAGRTTEGDIVLAGNNWVALTTVFAGVVGYVIGAYRMFNPRSVRTPQPRT
ncbi:MAG TPA: hypothetical protein VFE14_01665 [Micromonosporaceae bacterium]|nr:hypothetical protein [Micromonosporaceae bacterium]